MNSDLISFINERLEKADQAIKDSEILLGAGSYFGAVNRIYYAVFYAAKALLSTKGLDSSKHSGVISMFNQHFVKENIISKELSKILRDLFDARIQGDYEAKKIFKKSEVEEYLVWAHTFIAGIKQALEKIKGEK